MPARARRAPAAQIEVLKREVARLAGESSALRQDLLREADARAGAERAHYQATKQLEAQLAAAQFAREQAAQRLAGVERENEGLRQKAASLLSIGQQCGAGEPCADRGGGPGHAPSTCIRSGAGTLLQPAGANLACRCGCRHGCPRAAFQDHRVQAAGWVGC